ncbi:MAG: alpha/beta fold hydrolase [Limimaricola sp.]|uniref:alpha/beta fold hydrolase n=1 Tax=Limimaricola sp. TaxID=2211665 RepID=UPI001DCC1D06|nr:alpha/beta hydrolase [Limimaricola sp.]MBI1418749.1 alpha/beta fold hydrolase [Limimaricola sp.]
MGLRGLIVASVLAGSAALGLTPAPAFAQEAWQTVPDPAPLPPPDSSGNVPVNGLQIYYEVHGTSGPWIIFLHGGEGSALAWGNQVPAFDQHNRVLLIELRGHGRSTWDGKPITYEAMESDVIGVMDALKIDKADVVGWSDGGIVGLIMGIHDPSRVNKIVADGANTDPDGVDGSVFDSVPYNIPSTRDEDTYKALSPTPDQWDAFNTAINTMWENEPHITGQLGQITAPVLVMVGDHDLIKPEHTKMIADSIPNATLKIIPDAAHFIVWQQPAAFNAAVKDFLGVQ